MNIYPSQHPEEAKKVARLKWKLTAKLAARYIFMNRFVKKWAVPNLITLADFFKQIKEYANFFHINSW